MPDNTFRLFPDDNEASPGDALIQFLIEEQQKGNKRAKSIGKFLSQQMGKVFPGFDRALGDITSGAEERRKQLNETFGLRLGEPITPENISEIALGFGVGSIGRIPKVVGSGARSGKQRLVPSRDQKPSGQIKGEEIFEISDTKLILETVQKSKGTGQVNEQNTFISQPGTNLQFREGNIGGQRPSNRVLEGQAVDAAATKNIQAKVKRIQKDLDRLAISEVIPLGPQSLIQKIAKKGLRAKASHDSVNDRIIISFKSKTAKTDINDEFVILSTPDGPVLVVNFNSPTIKSELRPKFKEAFPKPKFIDDEIGQESQQGILQRMAGETSKDALPPDNFSYFNLDNFEDGLQVINTMLDIAGQ